VNLKRVRIPDMITQLETAFNVTADNDKAVSNPTGQPTHPPSSTLADRQLTYCFNLSDVRP
jgi:hypothetical protein